jgi:FKBP-type peptidyl-prolyl cis-trans isomerase
VLKDEAEIKYRVFLLDGTLCYSSDSAGPVKLRLGVGEQVSGLEEGLMLMVPGDKAHLILPAHLGYGMAGDQVKIPPASALYFDVELVNVTK